MARASVAARPRRWSPEFGLYWTSATTSYLGDGIRFAALPLLAASLSSSAFDVALIATAASLPWLLFGLAAGVIVDHVDRLRAMALLQLVRGALLFVIVASVLTGRSTIPLLAALVFVFSSLEVVSDVASHAALPQIVRPQNLQWANSRLIIAETTVFEFLGPAVGGVLFAVSTSLPLALDAVTFVASAVLLALLVRRVPARARAPAAGDDSRARLRGVWQEFVDGVRWFWRQPVLRALSFVAAYGNFAAGAFYALFVLFALDELGVGPAGYGLLLAVSAAGALAAGLLADRIITPRGRQISLVLTGPTDGLCVIALVLFPSLLLTTAMLVVFGFIVTLHNVLAVSLRQALTPDEVLGRMMSVHRFLSWGALPLGALTAGLLAEQIGVRPALVLCALAAGLAGVLALKPLMRAEPGSFAIGDEDAGLGSTTADDRI